MNRDELVQVAKQKGLTAEKRDWAMGKTIALYCNPIEEVSGIQAFEKLIYLIDDPLGWIVNNCFGFVSVALSDNEALQFIDDWINEADPRKYRELSKLLINYEIVEHAKDTAKSIVEELECKIDWKAGKTIAGNHVFRSTEDMYRVWFSHGGKPSEFPSIDFNNKMVITIFMDAGSYRICPGIQSVEVEDDLMKIYYSWREIPWKMINPHSIGIYPKSENECTFIGIKE